MGVRYTQKPIVYSTAIRSDSSADMIADLDAVLSKVAIARAGVTGGWKYTLQSPDGLQMKLWVQDLGDGDAFHSYVRITPTSADESLTGPPGFIALSQGTYEVWANCCQFFLAVFGTAGPFYNIACGVLALPSGSGPCTLSGSGPTVTEMWWASVATDSSFPLSQQNFRVARYDNANWCLAFNGAFVSTTGLSLCMMPLCETLYVNNDYAYGSPAAIARYSSGTGFRIDALVQVGQQIYGQLFDAHFYTLPATLDSTVSLTDIDSNGNPIDTSWVAWNNSVPSPPTAGTGTVLGTLFLLTGVAGESLANIAY